MCTASSLSTGEGPGVRLTFAELEGTTGFLLTEFLTFNRARITLQEAGGLQCGTILRVDFDQDTGDAEHCCFSLAFHTTTGGVDLDVVFVGRLNSFQRALYLVLQVYQRKILLVVFIIYGDGAGAAREKYTRYSFLTTANTVSLLFHVDGVC
jgi:hypothetical protein